MTLEEFVSICICPLCQSDLSIKMDASVLECANGHSYPLMNNRVPILLPDAERNKTKLNEPTNLQTSKSFSMQWQMYKEGDNIWGWNKNKMQERFFKNSGLKLNDILNKTVLDLGCGHGVFSAIMAEMGAQVIGFDISNGFLDMESSLNEDLKNRTNYIQGDVFCFPLREETVDVVWCSGVLHHTPNTKIAFDNVNRVVKKGGRFYLWVYKTVYYTPLLTVIRKITVKLPEKILVPLCYLMSPFFAFTKRLLTLLKLNYRTFERRTLRENALSIHDTLGHPYRWYHKKDEVRRWFEEAGFNNITVSEDSEVGFGIYGDRE